MTLNLDRDLSLELRQLLEKHRAIVEATVKPYVEIKFEPQPNLNLWQSKIGGFPYLPKNFPYPQGTDGQALQFLAQVNFAEVPNLPKFPEVGILQFYIAPDEDLYGANFEDLSANENFRVLYFPEIESDEAQLMSDFSFLPEYEYSPLSGSAALKFEKKFAPIAQGDYQFNDRLGSVFADVDDRLLEEYFEKVSQELGHRIGGYPGFTQNDPRIWNPAYRDFDCVLFQLDSERVANEFGGEVDLMWGDVGIANFFIKAEALEKLDFSEILFNWDCG